MTEGQFMRVSAIHAIGNSLLNLSFETNDTAGVGESTKGIFLYLPFSIQSSYILSFDSVDFL